MDPAFPDIVGAQADQIADNARVWIVERGTDGRLEERLDRSFLEALGHAAAIGDDVDASVSGAAREDISRTRIW